LEVERRKVRELQDASRERDKEYQKLKTQYDRVKRKALLGPNVKAQDTPAGVNALGATGGSRIDRQDSDEQLRRQRIGVPLGANVINNFDIGAVAAEMEATAVQRTPIASRAGSGGHQNGWQQASFQRQPTQRRPFAPGDRSLAPSISDRSDSGNEVEAMVLGISGRARNGMGWTPQDAKVRSSNRGPVIAPPSASKRPSGGFRPGGMTR